MAPPCVLQAKQKNMTQTVVAKIMDGPRLRNVLSMHSQTWVWDGGGAGAHVEIADGEHQGHYLVLTNKQLCEEHSFARRLQTQLQERPGSPQAEWVRPLTRRLQRLFHWGDVLATQNDVARACKAGDGNELKAIMPQAYSVVEEGRYEQLPKLFDALRNSEQLMLTDCSDDARALHDVLGHTWPEEPTRRA